MWLLWCRTSSPRVSFSKPHKLSFYPLFINIPIRLPSMILGPLAISSSPLKLSLWFWQKFFHYSSSHQAACIKVKSIHDHLALAHEVAQKLNQRLVGWSFCMKLDISKAFDKLNWTFLFNSLHHMGFSAQWIDLIKECVCNSKCSALINGEISGFFYTSCGLSKGDPLSPLIFSSLLTRFLVGTSSSL